MPDTSTRTQRTERFDLRALFETSQMLSASLDLGFVLDNLLLTTMSKLLVPRGVALLYDPVRDVSTVAAVKGMQGVAKDEVICVPEIKGGTMLREEEVPDVLRELKVELVLPVVSPHRQIGLIGLGAKATRQPFESRELEFVQSLVNMSSSAVYNSIIVDELRQANRDLDGKVQQLNTLFDLSQEFNATVDRERLVKLFSFALMGQMLVGKHLFLLGGASGRATVPEKGAYTFRIASSKGLSVDSLSPLLIEHLCSTDTLTLLQEDTCPEEWDEFRALGLVLALPIRHQGGTCGMLCLGPKMTGQPYQQDDLEFLSALANLAFVSVQNSYLVEEQIEKERLEEEMRLARQIQEQLQPREIPAHPGLELATLALPSRHVAGDYFDLVQLDGDRLLTAIADVTGKGMPASLLMSNLQACLHVMVPMDLSLADATGHINRVICRNTGFDKFITYFHGIYDHRDRSYKYVNAGHNPPTLVRANGELELLETGGLLLGVLSMPYECGTVTVNPGDVVVMFTDGVTEAMSPEEEEYGEERLEALLKAHRHQSAQDILEAIKADLIAFTDDALTHSDDVTMIVMKGV